MDAEASSTWEGLFWSLSHVGEWNVGTDGWGINTGAHVDVAEKGELVSSKLKLRSTGLSYDFAVETNQLWVCGAEANTKATRQE